YFSRGVLLEAELIAHDLAARSQKAQRIGLLFRVGDIGEQAAAAFSGAMGGSGATVVSRRLPAHGGDLRGALGGPGPGDAGGVWLGPGDLTAPPAAQLPPP